MRTFVPSVVLVFASLVLAPAGAEAPQASDAASPPARPTAVTMWIDGGFSPHTRRLQFRSDGRAEVEGLFGVEPAPGRYRSRVDYARVERLLTDAGVCTREAPPPGHPPGMDMFSYKVVVQCTDRTRYFTAFAGSPVKPDMVSVRDVIAGLEKIGAQLAWEPTAETATGPRAPDPPPALRRPRAPAPSASP